MMICDACGVLISRDPTKCSAPQFCGACRDCANTKEATQRWHGKRVRILGSGCSNHAGHVGTVDRASVLGNQTLIIITLDEPGPDDPKHWECCTVFPEYVEVL